MNDIPTSQAETGGEWVVPSVSYVEPLRNACALCGRPIPRRYWRSAAHGADLKFCGPDHAELYETYWMPVHGSGQRSERARTSSSQFPSGLSG
jgi:hypothetical protein